MRFSVKIQHYSRGYILFLSKNDHLSDWYFEETSILFAWTCQEFVGNCGFSEANLCGTTEERQSETKSRQGINKSSWKRSLISYWKNVLEDNFRIMLTDVDCILPTVALGLITVLFCLPKDRSLDYYQLPDTGSFCSHEYFFSYYAKRNEWYLNWS